MRTLTVRALRARWAMWRTRLRDAFALRAAAARGDEDEDSQEIARVRLTAELAADRLVHGQILFVANPWKVGTRYFVLWETSFHARLMQSEFDDTSPEVTWHAPRADLAALMA